MFPPWQERSAPQWDHGPSLGKAVSGNQKWVQPMNVVGVPHWGYSHLTRCLTGPCQPLRSLAPPVSCQGRWALPTPWAPGRGKGHLLHGEPWGAQTLGESPCRAHQAENIWFTGFQGRGLTPHPSRGCKGALPLPGSAEQHEPTRQEGPSLPSLPPPRGSLNKSGVSARAPQSRPPCPHPQK